MALTELEKNLIAGLKLNSVPKGNGIAIMLHLKTEDAQLEMLQYVLEHEEATADELLALAQRMGAEM